MSTGLQALIYLVKPGAGAQALATLIITRQSLWVAAIPGISVETLLNQLHCQRLMGMHHGQVYSSSRQLWFALRTFISCGSIGSSGLRGFTLAVSSAATKSGSTVHLQTKTKPFGDSTTIHKAT